jgi:hypothetical protein
VSQQVPALLTQQIHQGFVDEVAAVLPGVGTGLSARRRRWPSGSVFETVPGPGADVVFRALSVVSTT